MLRFVLIAFEAGRYSDHEWRQRPGEKTLGHDVIARRRGGCPAVGAHLPILFWSLLAHATVRSRDDPREPDI